MDERITCPECNGVGAHYFADQTLETCETCRGVGRVYAEDLGRQYMHLLSQFRKIAAVIAERTRQRDELEARLAGLRTAVEGLECHGLYRDLLNRDDVLELLDAEDTP